MYLRKKLLSLKRPLHGQFLGFAFITTYLLPQKNPSNFYKSYLAYAKETSNLKVSFPNRVSAQKLIEFYHSSNWA